MFEHHPKLPRAVWEEGNAPRPNVVPTDVITPESTQKGETIVIFGNIDRPHTELENKEGGKTVVVSRDNNQVGVVSEPTEIEPKSETPAKREASLSNEGVEPEQKETLEIKPHPIDDNVPVIKEAWIEGKEEPPTQDNGGDKDIPTTNIINENVIGSGNERGVSTFNEEPSLSVEDLEDNKGDNNDIIKQPEIPQVCINGHV